MYQQIYIRNSGFCAFFEEKRRATALASDEVNVEAHYSGINSPILSCLI